MSMSSQKVTPLAIVRPFAMLGTLIAAVSIGSCINSKQAQKSEIETQKQSQAAEKPKINLEKE